MPARLEPAMRGELPNLRAWPPRLNSAPPPPPETCSSWAALPRALAVAAVMFFLAGSVAGQTPPPESQPAPAASQAATYVGSEACQVCHEDIHKAFQKNPHIAVEKDKKRGWETHACQSCHGPGS